MYTFIYRSTYLVFLLVITCAEDSSMSDDGFCSKDNADECVDNAESVKLIRIEGHEIGHIGQVTISGKSLKMKTISLKPLIFEVLNFLSAEECDHFITIAKQEGLKDSITSRSHNQFNVLDLNGDQKLSIHEMRLTIEDSFDIYLDDNDVKNMYKEMNLDKNDDDYITQDELSHSSPAKFRQYLAQLTQKYPTLKSRLSQQVWMYPDQSTDGVFKAVQDRVQALTKIPKHLMKKSDFQVVRYGKEGHYNAHHDSNPIDTKIPCCKRSSTNQKCRICRFMTVLFYLNDVEEGGGTAFPVAGNETYNLQALRQGHGVNLYRHCKDANLIVPAEKGKR